jgi:hypothetical protein
LYSLFKNSSVFCKTVFQNSSFGSSQFFGHNMGSTTLNKVNLVSKRPEDNWLLVNKVKIAKIGTGCYQIFNTFWSREFFAKIVLGFYTIYSCMLFFSPIFQPFPHQHSSFFPSHLNINTNNNKFQKTSQHEGK